MQSFPQLGKNTFRKASGFRHRGKRVRLLLCVAKGLFEIAASPSVAAYKVLFYECVGGEARGKGSQVATTLSKIIQQLFCILKQTDLLQRHNPDAKWHSMVHLLLMYNEMSEERFKSASGASLYWASEKQLSQRTKQIFEVKLYSICFKQWLLNADEFWNIFFTVDKHSSVSCDEGSPNGALFSQSCNKEPLLPPSRGTRKRRHRRCTTSTHEGLHWHMAL